MSLNNLLDTNGPSGPIQSWKDLACDNLRLNSLQLAESSAVDLPALFENGTSSVSVTCQLIDLGKICMLKIPRVTLNGDGVAPDVEASSVIPVGQRPDTQTGSIVRFADLAGNPTPKDDFLTVTLGGNILFQDTTPGTGTFDSFITYVLWWTKA